MSNIINLCGRPGKCCPTIEKLKNGTYRIKDDFKGTVILTNVEMSMLFTAWKLKVCEQYHE